MEYKRTKRGVIYSEFALAGGTVRFRALAIRKAPTGIHATIEIWWNDHRLEWDALNIERRGDRQTMANSAEKTLPEVARTALLTTKVTIKAELDEFCADLWDEHMGQTRSKEMAGSRLVGRRMMLCPYLIEGGGTILFGKPGGCKSWLTYMLAQSINTGSDLFWPVHQRKVLMINLERDERSLVRRMAQVNASLGLPEEQTILTLNARGKTLKSVADSVRRDIEEYGVEVLAYDSISRSGAGSMNDDNVANEVADLLSGLCPTWLAIAHVRKEDDGTNDRSPTPFGSQMFGAAADVLVSLTSQDAEDSLSTGVALKVTKANDMAKGKRELLTLLFDDEGLAGVRAMRAGEFYELQGAGFISLKDKIASYMEECGPASATQLARVLNIPRLNISRALINDSAFTLDHHGLNNEAFYRLG